MILDWLIKTPLLIYISAKRKIIEWLDSLPALTSLVADPHYSKYPLRLPHKLTPGRRGQNYSYSTTLIAASSPLVSCTCHTALLATAPPNLKSMSQLVPYAPIGTMHFFIFFSKSLYCDFLCHSYLSSPAFDASGYSW